MCAALPLPLATVWLRIYAPWITVLHIPPKYVASESSEKAPGTDFPDQLHFKLIQILITSRGCSDSAA